MFNRLKIYFKEMFPIANFLGGLLLAISFLLLLHKFHGKTFHFDKLTILCALSTMFFILLIRLMDEFKDYEDDLVNYPDRPLPSGRVKLEDIRVLYYTVIVILIGLHITVPKLAMAGLVVFIFSLLMLKWFFMEKAIRASLPLALLSHHPIVYLYVGYIYVAYTMIDPGHDINSLLYGVPLAFTYTSWEISRKIRKPEHEDSYTTYSQVWGSKRAPCIAALCHYVTAIGFAHYYYTMKLPLWWTIGYLLGHIIISIPYFQFIKSFKISPNADIKRPLRIYSEYSMLWAKAALIISYFL